MIRDTGMAPEIDFNLDFSVCAVRLPRAPWVAAGVGHSIKGGGRKSLAYLIVTVMSVRSQKGTDYEVQITAGVEWSAGVLGTVVRRRCSYFNAGGRSISTLVENKP